MSVITTMGDSALQSGVYKFCSSVDIQKRKNEVRLSMSKMMNCCSSSKRRKTSSYDHHGASSFNAAHHEDLIWEILFCLPPKHVLRFKCVSKRWYSIISNPVFLRNHSLRYHLHRSRPQPLHNDFLLLPHDGVQDVLLLSNLLLDHDSHPDDQQPLADISVLPIAGVLPVAKGSDFRFIDSCNGLLLYADAYNPKREWSGFRCICHNWCIDDDEDLYYLFNPVTKNYIKLPDLKPALLFKQDDNRKVEYTNFDTRILFDPSVSLSYKVIRFVYRFVHGGYRRPGIDNQSQIYIYSSESAGSWRLSTSMACYQKFATNSGVFLNGVMYWVTAGTDLLCFDAEKNSVWFQPLPPNPKPKSTAHRVFYFGKCGGRLCLIVKYARTYTGLSGLTDLTLYDGFNIMEMTTEDARWTKKYHVNLGVNHRHLIAAKIQILHIYKTRTNQFKEEEEEALLLMKLDGRIVSFSFKSNTFFGKELTTPNSRHPFGFADVYPTSMTLFPL